METKENWEGMEDLKEDFQSLRQMKIDYVNLKTTDEKIKAIEKQAKLLTSLHNRLRIIEKREEALSKEADRQRLLCSLWVPYAYT